MDKGCGQGSDTRTPCQAGQPGTRPGSPSASHPPAKRGGAKLFYVGACPGDKGLWLWDGAGDTWAFSSVVKYNLLKSGFDRSTHLKLW